MSCRLYASVPTFAFEPRFDMWLPKIEHHLRWLNCFTIAILLCIQKKSRSRAITLLFEKKRGTKLGKTVGERNFGRNTKHDEQSATWFHENWRDNCHIQLRKNVLRKESATYILCLLNENLLAAFTEINEVDFVCKKLEPGRIFVVQCPYHAAYMKLYEHYAGSWKSGRYNECVCIKRMHGKRVQLNYSFQHMKLG